MRAAFVTCVEIGLSVMEEIYAIGGRLDLVATLPDDRARKKSGRIHPDAFCDQRAIPLLKVAHVDDPALAAAVRERAIDWLPCSSQPVSDRLFVSVCGAGSADVA